MSMTRAMWNRFRSLAADCKGATAVEYGLILAMIVIAMIVSLSTVANVTIDMWNNVNTKVTQATS
jgi:pilus assembly protein Flp/PilA